MIMNKKAEEIYNKVKDKIKVGKMVAIDIDSEDYFVGENTIDAYKKGRQKHPEAEFYFIRAGAKTAFVVGTR